MAHKRSQSWGGGKAGSRYSATFTELANKSAHAKRNTAIGGGVGKGEEARETSRLPNSARKTGRVGSGGGK